MTAKYTTNDTGIEGDKYSIDVISDDTRTTFSHQYQQRVLADVVKHLVLEHDLLDQITLPYRANYGRERVWLADSHSAGKKKIDVPEEVGEGAIVETKLKKKHKQDVAQALARECNTSVQFGPTWKR